MGIDWIDPLCVTSQSDTDISSKTRVCLKAGRQRESVQGLDSSINFVVGSTQHGQAPRDTRRCGLKVAVTIRVRNVPTGMSTGDSLAPPNTLSTPSCSADADIAKYDHVRHQRSREGWPNAWLASSFFRATSAQHRRCPPSLTAPFLAVPPSHDLVVVPCPSPSTAHMMPPTSTS